MIKSITILLTLFFLLSAIHVSYSENINLEQISKENIGSIIPMISNDGHIIYANKKNELIKSMNNGKTWVKLNFKCPTYNEVIAGFISSNNFLYISLSNGKVLRSTDDGNNWKYILEPSLGIKYYEYYENNQGIILLPGYEILLRTKDYGDTWEEIEYNYFSYYFCKNPKNNLLYCFDMSIYHAAFDSLDWISNNTKTYLWLNDESEFQIDTNGFLFLKTPNADNNNYWYEIFRSKDDGEYFESIFKYDSSCTFKLVNDLIFCYADNILHYSKDKGETWQQLDAGKTFFNDPVVSIMSNKNFVFFRTEKGNVFRSELSKLSVEEKSTISQLDVSAYPNPFSDKINIEINYPNGAAPREVKIFDIFGREITALSGGDLNWDASGMPSGIYIISASDGRNVVRKKVVKK